MLLKPKPKLKPKLKLKPKAKQRRTVTVTLLGGLMKLSNLSKSEREHLQELLTYDNPAYLSAKKFSRRDMQYSKIPECLTYYKKPRGVDDELIVPIGFNLSNIDTTLCDIEVKDERISVPFSPQYINSEYNGFELELREHQADAKNAFIDGMNLYDMKYNKYSGLIQMPTGKGKSILGLAIASELKQRTLVVVHKDDLVRGWKNDIQLAFGGKVTPSLIKGKERSIGAFLTIATIQTLNRLDEEQLEKLYNSFGLVICDECHHCPASQYKLLENMKAKYRLGLTATPERKDGLADIMTLNFGSIVYKAPVSAFDEDILPAKVIVKESNLKLIPYLEVTTDKYGNEFLGECFIEDNHKLKDNEIWITDLDYKERPQIPYSNLEDVVVTHPRYMSMVCADIREAYNHSHSCIVFFTRKEHCKKYYDYLTQNGTHACTPYFQIITGDTKDPDKALEKAENRECLVTLTTLAKSTEGTNVKSWEEVFLVTSINDGKNVEQAVGRVRRRKKGKPLIATVHDYQLPYVYTLNRHASTRMARYKKLGFKIEKETFKQGNIHFIKNSAL